MAKPIIATLIHETDFKIEKNIPLAKKGGAARAYPLDQMEVGDSFFVPGGKSGNVTPSAHYRGIKIKTRTVTESGVKGLRVWRVE